MLSVTLAYTWILIIRAVPSIRNYRDSLLWRFFLFTSLTALTSGNPRPRGMPLASVCTRAHLRLSLFVTITSDVTGANNVIPLRTPSHSAYPSPSFLKRMTLPLSSRPFCLRASRCTRIRAPTRFFLESRRAPRRSSHSVGRFHQNCTSSFSVYYTFYPRYFYFVLFAS